MKFGLIANLRRRGAPEAIAAFEEWANETGNELVLCDDLDELSESNLPMLSRQDIAGQVDMLVSMGGDGTLLASARQGGPAGVPVLGINLGSLGFLTQLQPHQLREALDKIVSGHFEIEKRMVLQAEIEGKPKLISPYALNDVVIDNGPIARLINISLSANGEEVVNYRADGLILATPTGSTAYSLAAGGPIVHPKMEAIVCSPISSFSLSTRPMIFPAGERLTLRIRSQHEVAGLTLDGQVMSPLMDDDEVTITRAEFYLKFVRFPDSSFYEVLRRKLHWGISPHSKYRG